MKARLITRYRDVTPEGNLIEMVIWRVPQPLSPCRHDFKYRLAWVVDGVCRIRFDNERGKGDHCHVDGTEWTYRFVDVATVVEDFIAEVEKWRNEH
ncbi:MAG: toxin-antitoxin system TumE family protein [Pseudomonadota bacterium]